MEQADQIISQTIVTPALPILVPMCTMILCLLAIRSLVAQRVISLIGMATHAAVVVGLAIAVHTDELGVVAVQSGGWAAPFGITVVADKLSVVMLVMTVLVALCVLVYAIGSLDLSREKMGFHPLYHALLTGVCGAFLTGDLFNLYVWFEVMLLSSFVLITLGGERSQLEGAIKYVTLNLLSSTFFLTAIGLLYGVAGTLNFADLHVKLAEISGDPERAEDARHVLSTLSMLFLAGFGIKAALWPFFFWLPASYHTPPPVVAAIFAGLLTKVGVYSVIRVFSLVFNQEPGFVFNVVLWLGAVSMLSGVLGAASQYEMRRILAFHSVSQVGYMLMGFAIAMLAMADGREETATLALGGTIYFMFHHAVVKLNLFLISGIMLHLRGTTHLKKLGGLFTADAPLSALFFVTSMALAGIPILSGFWAKLALVKAGLAAGQYVVVGVSLFVSVLTLFSMVKIWAEAYWKPEPEDAPARPARPGDVSLGLMFVTSSILAAVAVMIGVFVGPLIDVCTDAAAGVLRPASYVEAVLGGDAGGIYE